MWSIKEYLRKWFCSENPTKVIILCRGIPGSGKTTFAQSMSEGNLSEGKYPVLAADDYFMSEGEYKFKPEFLSEAHNTCQNRCEKYMQMNTKKIFISNTFTRAKELQPYIDLAKKYGYIVFSVIVENRHDGKNVHNVPEETLTRMEDNLRNNLKFR